MCIVFLPLKNRAITFCSGILMNRTGGLGVAFHDNSITFCYSVVLRRRNGSNQNRTWCVHAPGHILGAFYDRATAFYSRPAQK